MKAVFVELPAFEKWRARYLNDLSFLKFQSQMMETPEAGDLIPGASGLRKIRFKDGRRGKGKRGGLRVIYYWWDTGSEFWLFTLYDKNEASDLTSKERNALGARLRAELAARNKRK